MFGINQIAIEKRITAILMAIYIFFAGIPYGNEPAKVEFTVETSMGSCSDSFGNKGPSCRVVVTVENIGRPFIASNDEKPHAVVYRLVDGEKEYLSYSGGETVDEVVSQDVIIKHGQVRTLLLKLCFVRGYEPGEYILEVTVDHSDKVYTETITLM